MAKNTKTLSADVVKLSNEVRQLATELAKLKKGTLEYKVANEKLIQKTREAYQAADILGEKTKKLSSVNKTHVASINAATKAQQQFNASVKDASNLQNKAATGGGFLDKFLGSFSPQKLGSTLGTVTRFLGIGTAVFQAVEGFKQLTVESFKTFARLEQGFANLGAISNASAEQMQKLKTAALETAIQTGFTADQVIELETNLIKLGVSVDDTVASISTIAIASKALGQDVSAVGETLFKISNQFGLSSGEISITAATLVSSINESALTFEEFGTAIQYVGPIAKQAGLDFEQTAGFMEILSNAGFRASKIGTGLRDIFIDIKKPGESLTQTISNLAGQNLSLSQAVDLVGKTSAAQLLVLTRNVEEVNALNDATEQRIRNEEKISSLILQNSKQMNTTEQRLGILNAAWTQYKLRIGEAITGTELFLKVIGFLDKKSEQYARSVIAISGASQSQVQSAISQTRQNRSAIKPAIGLLSPESLKVLTEEAKRTETTLDNLLRKLASGRADYLTAYGVGTRNAAQEYLGLVGILTEETNKLVKSENISLIRLDQEKKFTQDFAKLQKSNFSERVKVAGTITDKLITEEKRLSTLIKKETNDREKELLKVRLETTKDLLESVSEYYVDQEDIKDEADKKENERLEKTKELQDAEEKRLKKLIEDRKREYEQKVESLELEKQLAEETGDLEKLYQIDLQLISERIKNYSELTKIIDDSTIATKEQKDEFKNSLDVFRVNNKDIADSVEDVSKLFKKFLELNPQGPSSIASPEFFDKFIQDYISGLEKAIGNISEEDRKRIESLLQAKLGEAFGANAVSENPTPDGGKGGRKKKPGIDSEDFKEELKKLANDAASALSESIEVIRDAAFDNLIGKLNAEKDAIQERYDFEDKVLRSQLDSQLITQEEYERKLESIKKKKIQSENAIQKKIFEAEKKRDRQNAGLAVAEAIASLAINNFKKFDTASGIILTAIGATIAGAQYAAQLSAINQRQFFPTRFAEGGIVNGPSHAEGGVQFSVKGRGGYEMEGGEFIVNKEATKRNYSLLRQINDSVKPSKYSVGRKFAAGGMVNAEEISVRQIELLENIAYATGTTSINTAKPVRAFVSSDDLRKSDVGLRVRERNSNL